MSNSCTHIHLPAALHVHEQLKPTGASATQSLSVWQFAKVGRQLPPTVGFLQQPVDVLHVEFRQSELLVHEPYVQLVLATQQLLVHVGYALGQSLLLAQALPLAHCVPEQQPLLHVLYPLA